MGRTVDRRDFVVRLATLAAGASLLGGRPLAGRSLDAGPIDGGRLDLHHHFFPPVAKKRYGPFPPLQDYSPGKALEEMVRAGVETAFLSLPTRLGDDPVTMRPEAVGFAREVNEYGARIASDHEGRFGLFAFLPLPDVDASLREIEYAFDTLGAHGVGLMTSYAGSWLGDRAFQPVFEELDRRHALVYSHPTDGPCCHDLQSNTIQTVEWNTDTSRAIWSVINDGTDRPPLTAPGPSMATRHANITFVWSHGGGTLLGLIGRFLGRGGTRNVDLSQAPAPDSKLHHLRRFYYDTALSANRVQMRGLQELVGSARIVFGSDYPFMPILDTVDGLKRCGFSPEELNGIDRTNALRILPSWGSR